MRQDGDSWQMLVRGDADVPLVGVVRPGDDDAEPWLLIDPDGVPVSAVAEWVRDLVLCDLSPRTVRAYCYALLTWYRVLWFCGCEWERASIDHCAAVVGWLRRAPNSQRRKRPGAQPAGTVNAITGKPSLGEGYGASTINLVLTAVYGFYAFHGSRGSGPVVNPVPASGSRRRALAHRSPLEVPRPYRRGRLRQKQVEVFPRSIPDLQFEELFAALTCDRDRALIASFVSSGARAAELLGALMSDLDWSTRRVSVVSKGTRVRRAVPLSPEAIGYLNRYFERDGAPSWSDPIFTTRRGQARAVSYAAARRVMQRANDRLATNWTLHDLRHTAAARMIRSGILTLPEVQLILGHADLRTTSRYTLPRVEDLCDKLQEFYAQPPEPGPRYPVEYSAEDLAVVFGPSGQAV